MQTPRRRMQSKKKEKALAVEKDEQRKGWESEGD
jgi:hypothetical protein